MLSLRPTSNKSLVLTRHRRCWTAAERSWHRLEARIDFISDLNSLLAQPRRFTLLATNSVLHHLPDPFATMRELQDLLAPGAFWLAGHEPSRRYYANSDCQSALAAFAKERKWRRLLSWDYYGERLRSWMAGKKSPAKAAASEAARRGLFSVPPPARVIGRLVDFHVPHRHTGQKQEGGFDIEVMSQQLDPSWRLVWAYSYSFMGRFHETELPRKWAGICRQLAEKFPLDGANFCSVWRFQP